MMPCVGTRLEVRFTGRLPKIRVGLEEFAIVRQQFEPLLSMPSDAMVGVMETAAASAMLHSFYTEIEKILKLIAKDWDNQLPSSESWHKDLLIQMSTATPKRPAVLSTGLVEVLGEFLAFRHLFRCFYCPDAMGEAASTGSEGRSHL
jgi:hypothetical protein